MTVFRGQRTAVRGQKSEGSDQKTVIRKQKTEVGDRRSQVREQGRKMNRNSGAIRSAKDLIVYKKAYELAMDIFRASKDFPIDEKYSLTDPIRRSSRSVCSNLRECWAKRRYEAHFISKLTDADGENGETETWLDFAFDCGYLSKNAHTLFTEKCREVGALLGSIINAPGSFILKSVH